MGEFLKSGRLKPKLSESGEGGITIDIQSTEVKEFDSYSIGSPAETLENRESVLLQKYETLLRGKMLPTSTGSLYQIQKVDQIDQLEKYYLHFERLINNNTPIPTDIELMLDADAGDGDSYEKFCTLLLDIATTPQPTEQPPTQPTTQEATPTSETRIELTDEQEEAFLSGLPKAAYTSLQKAANTLISSYDKKIKHENDRYTDLDPDLAQSLEFLIVKSQNDEKRKKLLLKRLYERRDDELNVAKLVCAIKNPRFKFNDDLPMDFVFGSEIGAESVIPALPDLVENEHTDIARRFANAGSLIPLLTTNLKGEGLKKAYDNLKSIVGSTANLNPKDELDFEENSQKYPLTRLHNLLDILQVSESLHNRIWEAVLNDPQMPFKLAGIQDRVMKEKVDLLTWGNLLKAGGIAAATAIIVSPFGSFVGNSIGGGVKGWFSDRLADWTPQQEIVRKEIPGEPNTPYVTKDNRRVSVVYTHTGSGKDTEFIRHEYATQKSENNFRLSDQLNSKTTHLVTFLKKMGQNVTIDVKTELNKAPETTLTMGDDASQSDIAATQQLTGQFQAMVDLKNNGQYFLRLKDLDGLTSDQLKAKIKEFEGLNLPTGPVALTRISEITTGQPVDLTKLEADAIRDDGQNIANTGNIGVGVVGTVIIAGGLAAWANSKRKALKK